MATDVQSHICARIVEPENADGVRYVARQPILDLHSKVHAYELLFNNGPGSQYPAANQTPPRGP